MAHYPPPWTLIEARQSAHGNERDQQKSIGAGSGSERTRAKGKVGSSSERARAQARWAARARGYEAALVLCKRRHRWAAALREHPHSSCASAGEDQHR